MLETSKHTLRGDLRIGFLFVPPSYNIGLLFFVSGSRFLEAGAFIRAIRS